MLRATIAIVLGISMASGWPVSRAFSDSIHLPPTWIEVHKHSDMGALSTSSNIIMAPTEGDAFIPFSIQPSVVPKISNIYAVAYSLDDNSLVAPVGRIMSSELMPFGLAKGGMVSMRISQADVKKLEKQSGLAAVRLAIVAPESTSSDNDPKWASDSVVFSFSNSEIASMGSSAGSAQTLGTSPAHT